MKVLQILESEQWGSRAAGVQATTRALVSRGHEVWAAASDGRIGHRFESAGAQVVVLPLLFQLWQPLDLVPFLYLFALCRSVQFDLVITHSPKGRLLGGIAARLAGVPHVVHHTCTCGDDVAGGPLHWARARVAKLGVATGDLSVAPSGELRARAIRSGIWRPERLVTVLRGVDIEHWGGANGDLIRREWGFHSDIRAIGAVADHTDAATCANIVRAMPTVLARHPNARLVIVGDPPQREELRQETVLMGLADRVLLSYPGAVSPSLLAALDVIVLLSDQPRGSYALLEAMAAGRAIIASNVPPNRELISHGQTGLLVPPENARAIACTISGLLDDPVRMRSLGARARSEALRVFSLDRMVEQNIDIYSQITGLESVLGVEPWMATKSAVASR